MFCFKCGAEIPDESEFCLKCGEKISNNTTRSRIANGSHKGNLCELIIESNKIIIKKKPLIKSITTQILFSDIVDVKYYPPVGLNYGSLLIITTQNLGDINLNKSQFASNPYVVNFTSKSNNEFSEVYSMLVELAKDNNNQDLIDKISSDTENALSDKQSAQKRIKDNKKNGIACCPKCGSTSLSVNKQGFGIGKAVLGAKITNDALGLAAGNINAQKVHVTCLNCGHKWKI